MFTILINFLGGKLSATFIAISVILLGILIVPNISAISEKLGIETRATLKGKLAEQTANTDKAVDANESLKKDTDVLKGTIVNIEKANTNIEEGKKASNDVVTKVTEKKKLGMAGIKLVPNVEQAEQVSAVQIASVWDAYCAYNPESTQCSIPVNG